MKTANIIIIIMSFLSMSLSAQETGGDMQLLRSWEAASVVSEESVERFSLDSCFMSMPVPPEVQSRMRGKSYKEGCEVPMESLRYLRLLHRNREGKVQLGEMVCNKSIASRLVSIFRSLYLQGYRIERMVLIDEYGADDTRSMTANNTSCFNYRKVAGYQKLSKHAQGLAVDNNTH